MDAAVLEEGAQAKARPLCHSDAAGFGEKDRLFLFDVVQKSIGIAVMLIYAWR